MLLVLDSGPLGLLANPAREGPPRLAREWANHRIRTGDRFVVPEISDYEVRRELIRAGKHQGVVRLDDLGASLGFHPLSTEVMRDAAVLWAEIRNQGLPTAPELALDGDVILAAQARSLAGNGPVVVATTNTKHLDRFVEARVWNDI